MTRLRALSAFLACLAVLASGVMAVAAAMPGVSTAVERSAATNAPCSHCDDCDGVPCPIPMPACAQVGGSGVPVLAAMAIDLPAIGSSSIDWPVASTSLSGLSPPPDPFPPRA
ncbi:MAG: hypothetical protein IKE60_15575 [Reyranella sp.]|jgi:hypothetical protein|uniref:hypothetical protein n=1 Tax=Reyranella sp. TaxID=1929291 RepID=UPI00095C3AB2|nr:hypothetical protein [Reyranella sp.]MBN9536858.1 hypothetical protein [Alphaproteobacteria bacterium]MBR2816070.1 hypothetical protein [Reyranella sp.]OJU34692.1 MAG: hypothetical protein BGN99_14445 [Alphaproteobacteria bacterium 65-37]